MERPINSLRCYKFYPLSPLVLDGDMSVSNDSYTAQAFSQSSEELGELRERHLTHFAVLPYEGNVMLNVPMPYLLLQHAHLAQSHIRSTTLTPAVVVVAVLVELIVADRKHSSD